MLAEGRRGRAVRSVRRHAHLGLAESRELVDVLATGTPPTSYHEAVRFLSSERPELSLRVRQLIREQRSVDAMRLLHEQTNLGLGGVKRVVDALEERS